MKAPISIIDALADPELFGSLGFDAPSWRPWRAFLKALYGLRMADDEFALYQHHTGRQRVPTSPARYAELVCGRRGGKTRILSLVAAYIAAIPDHSNYLVPGETAVVAVLAADRNQAKVALGYIVGFLREIPLFADLIVDELAETVRLNNRVTIEVHTASIASPRGRTFLAVLGDEIAFWPTGDSQNPDVEVINAVRPGLSTIPYSLLLLASSPYARKGVLYANYSKYFGKDDAPVLVWQGSTVEMNSSLADDPLIAEMALEDPERAAAEHGAQFRTDIAAFITREAVEDVVARGIRELPPGGGISYSGFVDPSGGSADSMTLAIAHLEGEVAVLSAIREVKPPFSPDAVVEDFSELLRSYGIARVVGDAYGGLWPRERFESRGIAYDVSERNKSTIYSEFLPALNGRRVRLLDNPRLIGQLVNLERRTARGGRDSVDHAPGAHDDVANAAAGVLTRVLLDRRPGLVKQTDVLVNNAGVPVPKYCRRLFCTIAVGLDGTSAIIWAATGYQGGLLILDFDARPMRGSIFNDAADGCRDWLAKCPATDGLPQGFAPAALAMQAQRAGVMLRPLPQDMVDRPETLFISAAVHSSAGRVRLCAPAVERAKTSPLGGALDFKPGDKTLDPLRLAALWAIGCALDTQ